MDLLHNLWNILNTEDENLTKYGILSLTFIEIYVTMKLSTIALNINYTKKQRNTYIIVMSILFILSTLLIPKQYSIFLHLFITPIVFKFIFKTSIIKAILSDIIPMLISVILESIYAELCIKVFGNTFLEVQYILIYRIPIMLVIYLTVFLLSMFIRIVKNNIHMFEHIDSYRKKLLIVNLTFIIIVIAVQFCLLIFYYNVLPLYIVLLSLISLIAYATVSIYSIIKTVNLEITQSDLEQSKLYNKTLELLYNTTRAFKHDLSNTLTALGGFVYAKDMDGLTKFYDKILDECQISNNLSTLNPEVINNPAVYNILATKYYKADELGINIDLQVFINLNNLKMDIYDFSKILGILLDNAIEATSQCDQKIIKIEIRDLKPNKCQILSIENTYLDKNIDLSKLSENGYTSKTKDKENHGIGLWQVDKLVKKHKNVLLDTSKNDELFKQELVIYYK